MNKILRTGMFAVLLAMLCGCATVAFFTAEKFGRARRAILAGRLDKACEAQQKLQAALISALEQFESLVKFEGGGRQKQANKLSAELTRCEARAKDVGARLAQVDQAAQNLFGEWKAAAEKHPDEMYQPDRGTERHNAQRDYNQVRAAMRRVESKTGPTLSMFRHQVEAVLPVFLDPSFRLDNNLNASAQASLQDESEKLAAQVNFLIQNLSDSIAIANLYTQKQAD